MCPGSRPNKERKRIVFICATLLIFITFCLAFLRIYILSQPVRAQSLPLLYFQGLVKRLLPSKHWSPICQWPLQTPLCCRKQCKYWSSTRLMSTRGTRTGRPRCTWRLPTRRSSVQKWSFPCWAASTSPTEGGARPCTTLLWMATWRWVPSRLGTRNLRRDSLSPGWNLSFPLRRLESVMLLSARQTLGNDSYF